ALSRTEVPMSARIEHDRSGPVQGCSLQRSTIRGWLPLARSSERFNGARRERDPSNAVIADIADEQELSARVNGNAVRLSQLRSGSWPAVTGESGRRLPNGRAEAACRRVHLTH